MLSTTKIFYRNLEISEGQSGVLSSDSEVMAKCGRYEAAWGKTSELEENRAKDRLPGDADCKGRLERRLPGKQGRRVDSRCVGHCLRTYTCKA